MLSGCLKSRGTEQRVAGGKRKFKKKKKDEVNMTTNYQPFPAMGGRLAL